MLGDVPLISIQDFSLYVTYLLQVLMLKICRMSRVLGFTMCTLSDAYYANISIKKVPQIIEFVEPIHLSSDYFSREIGL